MADTVRLRNTQTNLVWTIEKGTELHKRLSAEKDVNGNLVYEEARDKQKPQQEEKEKPKGKGKAS